MNLNSTKTSLIFLHDCFSWGFHSTLRFLKDLVNSSSPFWHLWCLILRFISDQLLKQNHQLVSTASMQLSGVQQHQGTWRAAHVEIGRHDAHIVSWRCQKGAARPNNVVSADSASSSVRPPRWPARNKRRLQSIAGCFDSMRLWINLVKRFISSIYHLYISISCNHQQTKHLRLSIAAEPHVETDHAKSQRCVFLYLLSDYTSRGNDVFLSSQHPDTSSWETRRRLARERKKCFSSSSEDGSRKR